MALAAIGHPEFTGRWFLRHIVLCATEDLKLGDSEGAVALWVGPGTEAYFANLKIGQ